MDFSKSNIKQTKVMLPANADESFRLFTKADFSCPNFHSPVDCNHGTHIYR